MLPGRLLDPGSNAGARGMITLSGSSGETELGLQTRFRYLSASDPDFRGDAGRPDVPDDIPFPSHREIGLSIPALPDTAESWVCLVVR